MKRKLSMLLLGLLFVASACAGGTSTPEVVEFFDGQFSALKPASWSMLSDLNDEADLQMGNLAKEAYCAVLTESKEDFADEFTLAEFSEVTRESLLSGVENPSVSGPESLTINGSPAIRYELKGAVGRVKITYWHVVVDTGGHFHQVLLWSLPSKFKGNRADFELFLNSIKTR